MHNNRDLMTQLLCVGVQETEFTQNLLLQQNPFSIKRGGLGYGLHGYVVFKNEKKLCNVRVSNEPGTLILNKDNTIKDTEASFGLLQIPEWYFQKISSQIEVGKVIQRHMFTHLVTVIGGTSCPLKGSKTGCKFCAFSAGNYKDINESFSEIIESLTIIFSEKTYPKLTISTPFLFEKDLELLSEGIRQIRENFPLLQIAIEIQPIFPAIAKKLKESGCDTLIVPLDAYSDKAQQVWIPGKRKLIQDIFWKSLQEYTNIFGIGNVVSNIITGIEPTEETFTAIDLLIGNGVLPDVLTIRADGYVTNTEDFMWLQDYVTTSWKEKYSGCKPTAGCITCGGCAASTFVF